MISDCLPQENEKKKKKKKKRERMDSQTKETVLSSHTTIIYYISEYI